jgi:hypothetical protein
MTKTTLPKSTAKTAYRLLTEIRGLILAEPKRYNQSRFIARANGVGLADTHTELGFPACGTVGCVAGWVATLKHSASFKYVQTETIAAKVLGLDEKQRWELFSGSACIATDPQTIEHAEQGAAHIAAFQKKYAKQLKAKAV